jgi:hypothetical protein
VEADQDRYPEGFGRAVETTALDLRSERDVEGDSRARRAI